jgi:3-deoxy-D-manno-octulosonic-acid transferase
MLSFIRLVLVMVSLHSNRQSVVRSHTHTHTQTHTRKLLMIILFPRAIDYLTNPHTRHENPHFEHWSEESKRVPQTMSVIAVALGCLAELKVSSFC